MTRTSHSTGNSRTQGLFVLAVTLYLLAVAGYFAWSFHQNPSASTLTGGLLLLAAAFLPMLALYRHAHATAKRDIARLNLELKRDIDQQKARETELKDAICDLERFNIVTVGREKRILELKDEVNTLLEQMKKPKRYNLGHINTSTQIRK